VNAVRFPPWLWLLAALLLAPALHGQVPALLPVPGQVAPSIRAELSARRAELLKRLTGLREAAKAYNDTWANRDLPEDDPLSRQGLAAKARLDRARADYVRDANAYNAAVQAVPPAGLGAVETRGEFFVVAADGHRLTGTVTAVPLEAGTRIVTGSDGHVRITLPDDTVFTIGANSDMTIDSFVWDPDDGHTILTSLAKGVFRWVTGKVARKDPARMKVTLPVLAVGIRGTDFEVSLEPGGAGTVRLYSGELEITERKTQRMFPLRAGEAVTFSAAGECSAPTAIEPPVG